MIKHLKNRWLINKVISPPGSQKEPSTKVLGFSFSDAFKSSFDKQGKRKNPTTAKQLGFYAWNVQCAGNMRSIIPLQRVQNVF